MFSYAPSVQAYVISKGKQMHIQKHVGILVFDEVEVLDFCGPFEVFSVVRLDEEHRRSQPSPFRVSLISQKGGQIEATGGLKVLTDFSIENCPSLNILLVPGGQGTRREVNNAELLNWIRLRNQEVELLTSVCTGAVMLGKAGLLDGLQATTHWKALDWFRQTCPSVNILNDQHVVEVGRIITSAGISAGIDMALKVVGRYFGEEIAISTARHMEYAYLTDNSRRI